MPFVLQLWHILLAALCGMVNERQHQIIQFPYGQKTPPNSKRHETRDLPKLIPLNLAQLPPVPRCNRFMTATP